MRSGARSKRAAFLAIVGPLAALACGRSVRNDDAREHGAAGESVGGGGGGSGGTGGSSTGGSPAGGSGAGGAGSAQGGAGNAQGGESAGAGSGGDGGRTIECVLAQTVACCPKWVPATREALEADECIVAVGREPAPGAFERCNGTTGCPDVECEYSIAPSRLLEPDGNGGCRYADECDTASDCEVAIDCCTCCACKNPMPRPLVFEQSCLVPKDNPPEPGDVPPDQCQLCPTALCVECTPKSETWSCNPTPAGVRRCEWGPALSTSQCANDRPCVNLFAGQNMRCYAPGETYCGGPAPPPDECAADVDCQTESREHYVCEPSGHCGMRACVPGCLTPDDCSIAEECGADHRCAPKPCSSEVCGNDHRCSSAGACQRKGCTSSLDCGGYCVNGSCYEAPGSCADANAP